MANITYEQAVARKLIPDDPNIQADILDQLGGQKNVFKSEQFYNQAIDKIVKEGYRRQEKAVMYKDAKTGEYVMGERIKPSSNLNEVLKIKEFAKQYGIPINDFNVYYGVPKGLEPTGYKGVGISKKPIYDMKIVDVFAPDLSTGQPGKTGSNYTGKDLLTADQLKQLTKLAKSGTQDVKRETATMKASRKRLTRATGGLMGKARVGEPELGPALGTTGLNMEDSILGGGIKL